MSKYRQAYTPKFRRQLVHLVHAGRSANAVAKEFAQHPIAQILRVCPSTLPLHMPPAISTSIANSNGATSADVRRVSNCWKK